METNRENWRSVDGHASYEVSTHGRVRNATTEKILKSYIRGCVYLAVRLYKDGKSKNHKKFIV